MIKTHAGQALAAAIKARPAANPAAVIDVLNRRLADAGAHLVLVDSLIPDYGGNLFNLDGYKQRVAVKTLTRAKLTDEKLRKRAAVEVKLHARLYHPNIARLYEVLVH